MAPNIHQLLNTSWTIHRLSPLHHEKEFKSLLANPPALQTYASRLRDQLTGNVFAGLQGPSATGEDESLSKTGALKNCSWETLSSWLQLADTDATSPRSQSAAGILVILEYENIVYKAALLGDPDEEKRSDQKESLSTSLPLLLTRLPNPLRQTFVSFLSANFDTYCSVLRLSQGFLCSALERYFDIFISSGPHDEGKNMLGDAVKEMQLGLSFSASVAPDLRSLNISVPRGSFLSFLSSNTFLVNLSSYLDKHLAMGLDLDSPSAPGSSPAKQHVWLSKVACGAFVIGSEGRLKLVLPRRNSDSEDSGTGRSEEEKLVLRASVALLQDVIRRASGQS